MFDKWYTLLTNASVGALTVDSTGQIYAVGSGLNSIPVTQNAFDPEYLSGYQGNVEPTGFLLKLDSTGTHVLYGTYLNGLIPFQVTVDSAGFIYVLASHVEPDFDSVFSYPAQITPNAVQAYPGASITPTLLKIAPTGELVYETFLGGVQAGVGGALTVDQAGSAYVCGSTTDPTLALSGAYQTKLHRNYDVYIAKLNPQGTAYQAFTYLGGDGIDECAGLQLDQAGNVYVYGDTNSRFFPVTPGALKPLAALVGAFFYPNLIRLCTLSSGRHTSAETTTPLPDRLWTVIQYQEHNRLPSRPTGVSSSPLSRMPLTFPFQRTPFRLPPGFV